MSLTRKPFEGSGDYESLVVAGNRLYISSGNGNKVVIYNSIPAQKEQLPDFAIGSPDLATNTLETNFFIQNGVPASNGKSLFVSSDFDRKLYVWKQLPDQNGAHPDFVYTLDSPPQDNALWGDTFVMASERAVHIWKRLPLAGNLPDLIIKDSIGSIQFLKLQGVVLDDRYFYLGDEAANRIYVWEGIPGKNSEPKYILQISGPRRLHRDGKYLVVASTFEHTVKVYRVVGLSSDDRPVIIGGAGKFNLPEGALAAQGHLFVGDTPNSRVLVWRDIEQALSGEWPTDVILGETSLEDKIPEIGWDKLFWPAAVSFAGSYLWVAERKFSNRLLRFSPTP